MAAKTQTLKFKRTVNAPPAEVYRVFTNATALREWFCDAAQAEARKGGRLYCWWNSGYYASGEFTGLTPDKKVAFTWCGRDEPEATRVRVSLAAKSGGTAVTVAHGGVGSGKKWVKALAEFKRSWEAALENLGSVLETGQDLRFVLRPMLGVNVGEFNAEVAAKLGAPVTEGVRLDGIDEGMGAQAAGLQKDDVVVSIGGTKTPGWTSLAAALQKHRAGDKVPVVFYRDGDRQTVTMELSRRPLPEVPPTPAGLAEAVRRINAEVEPEIEQCFTGVSDAEASHRPEPGEWSAKETLGHIIAGERDNHLWIAGLVSGQEPDTFPDNVTARYSGMSAVYSISALLDELKRNQAETVAMLAALPPEFVARKGSYWRIGYNLLQPPSHTRDHFVQMRAAIEAARRQ